MKKCTLILYTLLIHGVISAQNSNYLIKTNMQEKNTLYLKEIPSDQYNALYKSEKEYLKDITIAPNASHIAFIEMTNGVIEQGDYKVVPKNNLTIIDTKGKIVLSVTEDVKRYVWNYNGEKIAYIIGEYREDGEPSFRPAGVYILTITNGQKKKLENISPVYELHWLKTDNEDAIYLKTVTQNGNKQVLKYNIFTENIEVTNFNDINFSPDGKYYTVSESEAINTGLCNFPPKTGMTCFQIYETKTNEMVTEFSSTELGLPVSWVYNQGHLFLFKKEEIEYYNGKSNIGGKTITNKLIKGVKSSQNFIYDVKTKKIVQEFNGKVSTKNTYEEWLGNNDIMVVEKIDNDPQMKGQEKEVLIQRIPKEYQFNQK